MRKTITPIQKSIMRPYYGKRIVTLTVRKLVLSTANECDDR